MKSKIFTPFLIIVISVLIAHLLLVLSGILTVPLQGSLISEGFLAILFLGGMRGVIALTERVKLPFAQGFLVLTTVQMLSMLSVLLAFVFTKTVAFRALSFHLVSLFLILLTVQSILLIKWVNRSE